jgi:DNA helicase-2/ATP-dependent DNA helicase PcrA
MKSLALDDKTFPPRKIQTFINQRKEQAERAHHIDLIGADAWLQTCVQVYQNYEQYCQRAGLVDFAELLLRAYELLRDDAHLKLQYQSRFQHILVDEFQDSNYLQYEWLKLLAGEKNLLFVVGDDDQSIYGWRGARIEHIQHFHQAYPSVLTVRLEQNYRSTGTILAAANSVIRHNTNRLGKELWTADGSGEPIYLYTAYTETDEAEFVVEKIKNATEHYQENAILYRTSAQSRVFEEALVRAQIPYRIFGGTRFYERAEVKDLLAFLRLAALPDDDASFERVINTPKRGIGERTLETLRIAARKQGLSLWQAAQFLLRQGELKGRTATAITGFQDYLLQLAEHGRQLSLSELVRETVKSSGLPAHYQKEGKEEAQRRLENLEELATAAKEFELSGRDGNDPLTAFLAHAALEAGAGQGAAGDDCVQLMTLHLAKGLEFKRVFLCGLEEGLFPHQNSFDDGTLEEERRLCYVGITRARQQLLLSYSETRYRYGLRDFSRPSRFIREIPAELIDPVRMEKVQMNLSTHLAQAARFQLGDSVIHDKFGQGVIMEQEGQGEFARIKVWFETAGEKWLILAYSQLTPVK